MTQTFEAELTVGPKAIDAYSRLSYTMWFALGFARFSAIDNCLRINKGCGLPSGTVQIIDQFGNPALWTVREASGVLWISKDRGPALLEHEGYVQIIRTFDGRISLRPSPSQQRGVTAI